VPAPQKLRRDTVLDRIAEGSSVRAVTDEPTRNELPSGRAPTHDDEATTLDATMSRATTEE
jgi:hypothetical protein